MVCRVPLPPPARGLLKTLNLPCSEESGHSAPLRNIEWLNGPHE